MSLINDEGSSKHEFVSRLVGWAFHYQQYMELQRKYPNERIEAMHSPDDNVLNNHADNIKWGTQKQNHEDAVKKGRKRSPDTSIIPKHKRPEFEKDCDLLNEGKVTIEELCKKYECDRKTTYNYRRKWGKLKNLGKKLTDKDIEDAIELRREGYTQQEIADILGVTREAIREQTKKVKGLPNMSHKYTLSDYDNVVAMIEEGCSFSKIEVKTGVSQSEACRWKAGSLPLYLKKKIDERQYNQ